MAKPRQTNVVFKLSFYLISFLVPLFVAVAQFKFNLNNLSVPLVFENDETIYANQVFSIINDFSLKNQTFGTPIGQDLNHAFFSVDMGPALIASFFGFFSQNVYFGLNCALLLSFGLAGLFFFYSTQLLKLNKTYSLLAALIFALLPQHFITSTQAFTVSNYFPIPLVLTFFFLRLFRTDYPRPFQSTSKRVLERIFLLAFGAFYSYYSLGFVLISSSLLLVLFLLGRINFDSFRQASKLIFWVIGGFVISAVPALIAAFNSFDGINYLRDRSYWGVFVNSGMLAQSVIPIEGTLTRTVIALIFPRLDQNFSQFKDILLGQGLFSEGWTYVIPSGVVMLFVLSLVIIGIHLRNNFESSQKLELAKLSVSMASIGVIWVWSGGFGTILAMVSIGALRGFARLNVFVICAVLISSCALIPSKWNNKLSNNLLKLLGSLLLVFTLFDGLLPVVGTQAGSQSAKYKSLNQITNRLPDGCSVLQFPIVHYPYQSPGYPSYRLLSLGLSEHGNRFRWSSGSVGGSLGWHKISKFIYFQNSDSFDLREKAKDAGYCAILIDNTVWNIFQQFKPSEDFPNTPKLELANFLKNNIYFQEIITEYGNYYYVKL